MGYVTAKPGSGERSISVRDLRAKVSYGYPNCYIYLFSLYNMVTKKKKNSKILLSSGRLAKVWKFIAFLIRKLDMH